MNMINLSVLALAASLAITAPAMASTTIPVSKTVSYADLNLASDAGMATLDKRIDHAARSVCNMSATHNLQDATRARTCYATARASAKAQLGRKS